MCGRYLALTEDEIIKIRAIIQEISLRLVRDDFEDYAEKPGEIVPTSQAPVIIKQDDGVSFENARFGFKRWDGKGVIINARSETMKSKSTFINHIDNGRCVVPAREYYEWKEKELNKQAPESQTKMKKQPKIKHFIKDTEGNLLFFAGLYRDTPDGKEFVIITKGAVGDVTDIHDRMPVILRVNQIESWLNGELTPEDIVKMDFNASVFPCEDIIEHDDDENMQLSLFT